MSYHYEAWRPKTARPACPGTAISHIQTCAGTVSRGNLNPENPQEDATQLIAVRQKTNHEELSLAFFQNKYFCVLLNNWKQGGANICYTKKGNILKLYTITNIKNVYLQTFTHKCVPNLPDTASGYDNSPAGTGDSIPSRCLNPVLKGCWADT